MNRVLPLVFVTAAALLGSLSELHAGQPEAALRERIEQIESDIKAREKEKEQQRLDEGTVG